jgi:hypothetical protein
MGREAECYGELGQEAGEVSAMLESREIRLRGAFKAILHYDDLRKLTVRDNALQALTPRGQLRLHLGEVEAGKWLDRIESPPSLAKKLGINPGTRVHLVSSPLEVRDVLSDAGAEMVSLSDAELAFIVVVSLEDLRAMKELASTLPQGIYLWVLRQKGKKVEVKESEIMATLRTQGFAPSKTAAWSDVYSADRYGQARDRA